MNWKKLLVRSCIASLTLVIGMTWYANWRVSKDTAHLIFEEINEIPENNVALLLGTSQFLASGDENLYFSYRIQAAIELYESGKVSYFVVSGDNSTKIYNEPEDMRAELIKYGVPRDRIFLDYAGFRTFDSVYRMKEIFGQKQFTIVSQKFHNERALYIARALSIDAIAFNAKDVNVRAGFKTRLREKFARVKVLLDIVIGKKPKFLGDSVFIPVVSESNNAVH